MRLVTTSHSTVQLTVKDDKSDYHLEMNYDDQIEAFQLSFIDPNGQVQPLDSMRRRDGEHDEVFFDRCSAMAHRIYLNKISEVIEQQSRYERSQYTLGQIREKLNHMELVIEHWDNEAPTAEELDQLQQLFFSIRTNDETLSTLS